METQNIKQKKTGSIKNNLHTQWNLNVPTIWVLLCTFRENTGYSRSESQSYAVHGCGLYFVLCVHGILYFEWKVLGIQVCFYPDLSDLATHAGLHRHSYRAYFLCALFQ